MTALAQRVVRRFLADHSDTTDYLKKSKLFEVVLGMTGQAKKVGAKFGMNDARATMKAFFEDKEGTSPAEKAGLEFLVSPKGQKLMVPIIKGVTETLKKSKGRVGFKDIGEAISDYLK